MSSLSSSLEKKSANKQLVNDYDIEEEESIDQILLRYASEFNKKKIQANTPTQPPPPPPLPVPKTSNKTIKSLIKN